MYTTIVVLTVYLNVNLVSDRPHIPKITIRTILQMKSNKSINDTNNKMVLIHLTLNSNG